MTQKSWTELQSLAVRAASGASVPAAQALAFGAMLPRHLADGGAEAPLLAALDTPEVIVALAQRVEQMIEAASLSAHTVRVQEADAGQRAVLISWLASLPCQVALTNTQNDIHARLSLSEPSTRTRPARLEITETLFDRMQVLAARTYVPDSAASRAGGAGPAEGAGLMDLD